MNFNKCQIYFNKPGKYQVDLRSDSKNNADFKVEIPGSPNRQSPGYFTPAGTPKTGFKVPIPESPMRNPSLPCSPAGTPKSDPSMAPRSSPSPKSGVFPSCQLFQQ